MVAPGGRGRRRGRRLGGGGSGGEIRAADFRRAAAVAVGLVGVGSFGDQARQVRRGPGLGRGAGARRRRRRLLVVPVGAGVVGQGQRRGSGADAAGLEGDRRGVDAEEAGAPSQRVGVGVENLMIRAHVPRKAHRLPGVAVPDRPAVVRRRRRLVVGERVLPRPVFVRRATDVSLEHQPVDRAGREGAAAARARVGVVPRRTRTASAERRERRRAGPVGAAAGAVGIDLGAERRRASDRGAELGGDAVQLPPAGVAAGGEVGGVRILGVESASLILIADVHVEGVLRLAEVADHRGGAGLRRGEGEQPQPEQAGRQRGGGRVRRKQGKNGRPLAPVSRALHCFFPRNPQGRTGNRLFRRAPAEGLRPPAEE